MDFPPFHFTHAYQPTSPPPPPPQLSIPPIPPPPLLYPNKSFSRPRHLQGTMCKTGLIGPYLIRLTFGMCLFSRILPYKTTLEILPFYLCKLYKHASMLYVLKMYLKIQDFQYIPQGKTYHNDGFEKYRKIKE